MGDAVEVDLRHLPCRSLDSRFSAVELFVRHFFTSGSGLDFRCADSSLTIGFRHFIFSDEGISDNTANVKRNSVQTLAVYIASDFCVVTRIVNFCLT